VLIAVLGRFWGPGTAFGSGHGGFAVALSCRTPPLMKTKGFRPTSTTSHWQGD